MSTTWYKTPGVSRPTIEPVEAEKHTEHFIFIRDPYGYGTLSAKAKVVRLARVSQWSCYFPTWEEAHAYLLDAAERTVKSCRVSLEQANGRLGNIKGLKKPEAA